MLVVINEHTRDRLAIEVDRRFNAQRVLETLADLIVEHRPSEHVCSDNQYEFIAAALRDWLARLGVRRSKLGRVTLAKIVIAKA